MLSRRAVLRTYGLLGVVARLGGGPLFRFRIGRQTVGRRMDRGLRRLIGPAIRPPNPACVQGHLLQYPPGDVFEHDYLSLDNYEPGTTRLIQGLLGPGMTFVDLGAYIGYYTLLAARQVGERGRVYAFEPSPYALELLRRNIATNGYEGGVTVEPKAICSAVGRSRLFLPRSLQDLSVLSLYRAAGVADSPFVEVETITLDAYFGSRGWPPVDLIKMDIEGAEKAALAGMAELGHRNPNLKMIVEFAPLPMRAAGVSPQQYFSAIRGLGFSELSLVRRFPQRLDVPRDIGRLLEIAGDEAVNLLCERTAAPR